MSTSEQNAKYNQIFKNVYSYLFQNLFRSNNLVFFSAQEAGHQFEVNNSNNESNNENTIGRHAHGVCTLYKWL